MYLYSYLDSINLENKIIPKFENVSLEHLLIKSLSEERLSNQEQVSLINQDLIKEAKVNMKELHLSSKPNQSKYFENFGGKIEFISKKITFLFKFLYLSFSNVNKYSELSNQFLHRFRL